MKPSIYKQIDQADLIEAINRVTMQCFSDTVPYKSVVVFVAPDFIVRATRLRKSSARDRTADMRLTAGRPNYAERAMAVKYQREGMLATMIANKVTISKPFPIKKKGSK